MIMEAIGGSGGGGALSSLKAIRILRLTKLLRLAKMAQILETIEFNMPSLAVVIGFCGERGRMCARARCLLCVQVFTPSLAVAIGLFRLGFTMFIVSHFNACLFYWIGKLNIGNSWISKYTFGCCDTSKTLFTMQDYGGDWGPDDCFDVADLPGPDTMYVDSVYWFSHTLSLTHTLSLSLPLPL